MDRLDPTDPPLLAGYRLLGRLGSGGMGRVYLARSRTGVLVALKTMLPSLAHSTEFRARFHHEIIAASAVRSPYVAEMIEADPNADPPWLATRYVAGPSLTTAVARLGPLPTPTVAALATGIAAALVAVQRAGLVHQDLKPSNILMERDGPRLIDFGVAASLAAGRPRRRVMVGTPAFMAPEQISGAPIGPAADIFGLGSVLTYALTGTGPFGDGEPWELLDRVLHRAPDLTRVPCGWRPLLRQCLAKDTTERPTSLALLTSLVPAGELVSHRFGTRWLPPPLMAYIDEYKVLDGPTPPRPRPRRSAPRPLPVRRTPAAPAGPTRTEASARCRRRPRVWPMLATLAMLGASTVPAAVAQVAPPQTDSPPSLASAGHLPDVYTGAWTGMVHERHRDLAYPVRVTLVGGAVGSIVGSVEYWTRSCQGRLWLEGVSASSVRLTEEIVWGAEHCDTTQTWHLAVRPDGTLDYLSDSRAGPGRLEGALADDLPDPTG